MCNVTILLPTIWLNCLVKLSLKVFIILFYNYLTYFVYAVVRATDTKYNKYTFNIYLVLWSITNE